MLQTLLQHLLFENICSPIVNNGYLFCRVSLTIPLYTSFIRSVKKLSRS